MRQRIAQLFFWFFCGEWLLLQRRWLSPSTIALITLVVLARAWLLQTVPLFPLYPYAGLVVALVALVRFFKAFSLATRRRRAHYNVPPWGLPWTSFLIGPRPVPSALGSKLIEPVTALLVTVALMVMDRVLMPHLASLIELTHLPVLAALETWIRLHPLHVVMPPLTSLVALTQLPVFAAWDTWIRQHPLDAANCALFTPVLMFYCHNMGEWRVMHPRPQRSRQRPAKASDFFPRVRERRLRLPQVPSVEALAKHFRRRYGVG
jgi:hypothetical protein